MLVQDVPVLVVPELGIWLNSPRQPVLCDSMRCFERSRVKWILRIKRIRIVINKILDLLLPLSAQPVRPLPPALLLKRVDQVNNQHLIVQAESISPVPSGSVREIVQPGKPEVGFRRPECPLQVTRTVQVVRRSWVELRNLVHVKVEHDHMRIIVAAPDMFQTFPLGPEPVLTVPVLIPVGHAIDKVRVRLFDIRALQPAPYKLLNVVLDRINLLLLGEMHVLRRNERRLRQSRVVAGQRITVPAVESARVLRTP